MRFYFAVLITALMLPACAGRKISQVGLREPSSLEESNSREVLSEARSRLGALSDTSPPCPENITKQISKIAFSKISQPRCPERFSARIQTVSNMLLLEERSILEEIVGAQCQGIIRSQQEERLQTFVEGFENTGPSGRRRNITESLLSQENDFAELSSLKESLQELMLINLPLERWLVRHGKFLLPEEDVDFLYTLVAKQNCRMGSTDFERLYRSQERLENLERMLTDENQKQSIHKFVESLHKITDSKVKEFFYPKRE